MKTKPSVQLSIIPKAVVNAVIPKPTKAEIIEAMAQRKFTVLTKERDEQNAANKLEQESIDAEVRVIASQLPLPVAVVHVGWISNSRITNMSVSFTHPDFENHLTPQLRSRILKLRDKRNQAAQVPDVCDIKREIRESMNTMNERVGAMLGDATVTKALDKMLAALP